MKAITSSKELDYRWARVTAISGIAGVVAYVVLLAVDPSATFAVALALSFAFGVTVSSIGCITFLGKSQVPDWSSL